MSMVTEMATQMVLVDCVGIWNVSDEDLFRENADKMFLGTLCVGKRAV